MEKINSLHKRLVLMCNEIYKAGVMQQQSIIHHLLVTITHDRRERCPTTIARIVTYYMCAFNFEF